MAGSQRADNRILTLLGRTMWRRGFIGEILRLDAYARSGLIYAGEDIPTDLLAAAQELAAAGYNGRALA